MTENSRKIDAVPLPFKLADIQKEDILAAAQYASVGWYMDVGTGKTVCSTLTAILWNNQRNYVLVPPIIIDQWEDWLRSIGETDIGVFRGPQRTPDLLQHKWVIMSHTIFRDSFTAVLESVPRSYSIIVDECFVGETLVLTELGPIPIKEVVENKVGNWAQSLNFSNNALEWKRIVRRLANPAKPLLKVTHEYGSFVCTESHKIATVDSETTASSKRWTKAGELHVGDILTVLQGAELNGDLYMQGLPTEVCSEEVCQQNLLLHTLQDGRPEAESSVTAEVEGFYAGSLEGLPNQRGAKARLVGAYAGEQSNEESGESSKDAEDFSVDWSQTSDQRGQWERGNRGSTENTGGITGSSSGVCSKHSYGEISTPQSAELLQGRYCNSSEETSDRGGRSFTSTIEKTSAGQEKGGVLKLSRVVSIEVYEQRSEGKPAGSNSENQTVYDLEVEDNHNYFANGTLVSNCQYLKNPASKLFKYVKTMANGRHLQLLTGTPTSKPEDSYAYIHLLTKVYRSFGHWKNTHVDEIDFFGNIKTYKNLDLVTSNMKLLSFKRTKKDIFGHNLDPIYQVIPYSLDKAHQKLYEKLAEEQLLLLLDGGKIDASSPTRLYHALQQIVLQWSKFCGEPKRSAGYDVLDEVIEEVDPMDKTKSKLVVWTYYQHTSGEVVQYLREKFGERAIAATYSKVNSQKGIDAIMKDPECRILVAQPSSCGVGLNLQHVCSEMLFLELSTTPMQAKQAIGRVDRAGQKIRPTVRIAQAKRTIQVRLLQQLLANDDLVAKVEDLVSTLRGAIFGD